MNRLDVLEIKVNFGATQNTIFPVILSDENEMVLVDCGYPGMFPLIKDMAKVKGIDIDKLTKIIITHHDIDHMGALAQFKREYPNIKILTSKDDEKYISGKEKSLRLEQAEKRYNTLPEEEKEGARQYQKRLLAVEKVNVDVCLNDKDSFDFCGGVEIVATPGHMPGHIAVYAKQSKTLIAGDAMVVENNKLHMANPRYTLDMHTARESIKKLVDYDIDTIICYHGGIYNTNVKEALKRLS